MPLRKRVSKEPRDIKKNRIGRAVKTAARNIPLDENLYETILRLQATLGNRAVLQMIADGLFRPGEVQRELEGQADSASLDNDRKRFLKAVNYFARGWSYFNLNLYNSAATNFDRVLELGLKTAEVYTARGRAYYELGLYNEAVDDFDRVLKKNPNYKDALDYRGWSRIKLGEHDPAKKDFERSLTIDPYNEVAKEGQRRAEIKERIQVAMIRGLADKEKVYDLQPTEAIMLLRIDNNEDLFDILELSPEAMKQLLYQVVMDNWVEVLGAKTCYARVVYGERVFASAALHYNIDPKKIDLVTYEGEGGRPIIVEDLKYLPSKAPRKEKTEEDDEWWLIDLIEDIFNIDL